MRVVCGNFLYREGWERDTSPMLEEYNQDFFVRVCHGGQRESTSHILLRILSLKLLLATAVVPA